MPFGWLMSAIRFGRMRWSHLDTPQFSTSLGCTAKCAVFHTSSDISLTGCGFYSFTFQWNSLTHFSDLRYFYSLLPPLFPPSLCFPLPIPPAPLNFSLSMLTPRNERLIRLHRGLLARAVKGSPSGTAVIYWNETKTASHPSRLTLSKAHSSYICTALRKHKTIPLTGASTFHCVQVQVCFSYIYLLAAKLLCIEYNQQINLILTKTKLFQQLSNQHCIAHKQFH